MKLEEHTLKEIRKKLAAVLNAVKIPRYSKLTKPQLIKAIREHPAIEVVEKEGREVGLKVKKVGLLVKTHKMPNGKVMTGAKHTAASKPVKKMIKADSKVGKAITEKSAKDKKAKERREKVKGKLKDISYKKPKKERSAAQKANTARMVEANKKRRAKK